MTSDILLRGKGATIQGLPALLPQEEVNPIPKYSSKPIELQKPPEPKKVVPPPQEKIIPTVAENLERKNKLKKIFVIAISFIVLLIVLAGAFMLYMRMRGPAVASILTATVSQFMSATSFSYNGSASSDLVLTSSVTGESKVGTMKFALGYAGQLNADKNGFGNGNHHMKFSGGWQYGDTPWKTDVETDLRMFAQNLYFHVMSFPSAAAVDPELFRTYWIKVDIGEIAKQLALEAVTPSDQYSGIAGEDTTSFNAIVRKHMPFMGGAKVGTEVVNSINTIHYSLTTDPEKLYGISADLYKKYTGKTLVFNEQERIDFIHALEKLSFDIWIDEKTNNLLQIKIAATLNDNIAGIHAVGPLDLSFSFTGYDSPVIVSEPAPYLSLTELQTRMDDYRKSKEIRDRNAVRILNLGEIKYALASYQSQKGRFPTVLADLRQNSILASTTLSDEVLKSFSYSAFIRSDDFSKANKCTAKSIKCTTYHIGVNLDDPADPALASDADQTSDIHGADNAGCAIEREKQCYDLVFTVQSTASSTKAQ